MPRPSNPDITKIVDELNVTRATARNIYLRRLKNNGVDIEIKHYDKTRANEAKRIAKEKNKDITAEYTVRIYRWDQPLKRWVTSSKRLETYIVPKGFDDAFKIDK